MREFIQFLAQNAWRRIRTPSWFMPGDEYWAGWALYRRWREIDQARTRFVFTLSVNSSNGALKDWAETEADELNQLDDLGRWQALLRFCDVPEHLLADIPVDKIVIAALAHYTSSSDGR
jgi:hypothetical protein